MSDSGVPYEIPPMRRGVPLAYVQEKLGEPSHAESFESDQMRVSMRAWRCELKEPGMPCTALQMAPPTGEDVPEGDVWVRPCRGHEHLFADFAVVTVGTQAWGEQA